MNNQIMIIFIIKNILSIFLFFYFNKIFKKSKKLGMGIGDWGLGIGPNPQSPKPI